MGVDRREVYVRNMQCASQRYSDLQLHPYIAAGDGSSF